MKTVINIKTDKETKEKAQKLAADLGLNLTTLINAYLRHFIRTKKFSFSLTGEEEPEMNEIIKDAVENNQRK